MVKPGDKIEVEKIDAEEGKEITFPEVLLLNETIGTPLVKGAKVIGKVLKQAKGEKLIIFKYKPKKRYKRKIGHRQKLTHVEIVGIS